MALVVLMLFGGGIEKKEMESLGRMDERMDEGTKPD